MYDLVSDINNKAYNFEKPQESHRDKKFRGKFSPTVNNNGIGPSPQTAHSLLTGFIGIVFIILPPSLTTTHPSVHVLDL